MIRNGTLVWFDVWHLIVIVAVIVIGRWWYAAVRTLGKLHEKHHYYYALAIALVVPTWHTSEVTLFVVGLLRAFLIVMAADDYFEHWVQLVSGNMTIGSPLLKWYAGSWLYVLAKKLHLDT